MAFATATYGACQTVCNGIYVACCAAAGYTAGTFTLGAGVPAALTACSVNQGLCMTACAASAAAVGTAEVAAGTASLASGIATVGTAGYGLWSWLGYSAASGGAAAGTATAGTAAGAAAATAGAAAAAEVASVGTASAASTAALAGGFATFLPAMAVSSLAAYAVYRYREHKRLAALSVDDVAAEIQALAVTDPLSAARLAANFKRVHDHLDAVDKPPSDNKVISRYEPLPFPPVDDPKAFDSHAEVIAMTFMRDQLGFRDAKVSGGIHDPDGGVDVVSRAAVAQVKANFRGTGIKRGPIMQLIGDTTPPSPFAGRRLIFFAVSFTGDAIRAAVERGVWLFKFDSQGVVACVTSEAR
jgi:hypothetical protein